MLDDVINKYNNTVHRAIKMKPTDVTFHSLPCTMKILMKKILNAKNAKTFLLKDTRKTDQKKFLLLVKLRIQFRGYRS